MAQTDNTKGNSSRAYALARRKALSGSGKAALQSSSAPGGGSSQSNTVVASSTSQVMPSPGKVVAASSKNASSGGRAASLARRRAMSTQGKSGVNSSDRTRTMIKTSATKPAAAPEAVEAASDKGCGCGCGCNGTNKETCNSSAQTTATSPRVSSSMLKRKPRKIVNSDSCRAGALARRKALSTRGKAGISSKGMSSAQTARASNPDISSRELARAIRDQKSRKGSAGQKKSESPRRMRPARNAETGAAQDASWKVGESETAQGQTLTGTMVGRSQRVTGDEPSTCRDVTGTEYLGADIFREFCQTDPAKKVRKVGVTSTSHGNAVSGNKVGRSQNVTGDEPGSCQMVTGNEYISSSQLEKFCGSKVEAGPRKVTRTETQKGKALTGNNVGRSGKVTGDETGADRELTGTQYLTAQEEGSALKKVGTSTTLRGGSVSGTMVGRSGLVTGDEPGSCRNVTGDDYIGHEQYGKFCDKAPVADDQKVGVSSTLSGKSVTGTMTDRSGKVTGDEPGTCKAVTGTPYASANQYASFCDSSEADMAAARTSPKRGTVGSVMTGIQPGIGGKMTGADKGACESLSGTPYVGADQMAEACPATAADPVSPDFPQPLADAPWTQSSITSPAAAAQQQNVGVTGGEAKGGNITGSFNMAVGKVTGTEDARFGKNPAQQSAPAVAATAELVEGRVKSRISGEGMDAGQKITGDDWDRGEHVTGTEGTSAIQRNPTIRSKPMAMAMTAPKRNEEMQTPVSKVTGGSGNTENGAFVTYSGGARG